MYKYMYKYKYKLVQDVCQRSTCSNDTDRYCVCPFKNRHPASIRLTWMTVCKNKHHLGPCIPSTNEWILWMNHVLGLWCTWRLKIMIFLTIKAWSTLMYSNGTSQLAQIITTFAYLADWSKVTAIVHGNAVVEAVRHIQITIRVQAHAIWIVKFTEPKAFFPNLI